MLKPLGVHALHLSSPISDTGRIQLDIKSNSQPIAHFRFSNVVIRNQKQKNLDLLDTNYVWEESQTFRNQKSKKEKWKCSQTLDLNPTCIRKLWNGKVTCNAWSPIHIDQNFQFMILGELMEPFALVSFCVVLFLSFRNVSISLVNWSTIFNTSLIFHVT